MHRIDNATAIPALPVPAPVGIPGFFTNGDPRRGQLATRLDRDFFNSLQEEIAHVIEEAGLELDKARFDQLLLAILIHIQRGLPPMPFLPLAGGTMQGPIYQHIAPSNPAELVHMNYVDGRDNVVIAHSDAMDVHYHNEAVGYANARAIQEGDRAQNNAWTWDQAIWDRLNWIDQTQGGIGWITADSMFTVPAAARIIIPRCTGGGGGGGACHDINHAGGGGGAGGTCIGAFNVVPGQQFWCTVGAGGAPGADGWQGGAGGATQFGDLLGAAGGGGGGGSRNDNPAGAGGGSGYGNGLSIVGGFGGDGAEYRWHNIPAHQGGNGGASIWGGGGRAATGTGYDGWAWGSGAGASYHTPGGNGGRGAPGIIVIHWHR